MATVKRKHSRARGRTRRAGHPKLEAAATRACPKCGEITSILRSGAGQKIAADMGVPFLGAIPIDPQIVQACDDGTAFISRFAESPTAQIMHRITQPIIALDQHK